VSVEERQKDKEDEEVGWTMHEVVQVRLKLALTG
jgi:hypothetical protein